MSLLLLLPIKKTINDFLMNPCYVFKILKLLYIELNASTKVKGFQSNINHYMFKYHCYPIIN
jgi:hypothetical protein